MRSLILGVLLIYNIYSFGQFKSAATSNTLYDICPRLDGSLFVTSDNGIYKNTNNSWTLFTSGGSVNFGDYVLRKIYKQPASNNFYISSNKGIVAITTNVDGITGATVYNQSSGLLSNNVVDLYITNAGAKWILSDNGISLFDNGNWLTSEVYLYDKSSNLSTLTCIIEHKDTAYIGSLGGGVDRIIKTVDGFTGASAKLYNGYGCIINDTVYSIYCDTKGFKWFGSDKGIVRYNGGAYYKGNTSKVYTIIDTNSGLINNSVRSIAEDSTGNIWIGTLGGISKYNGTFTNYTTDDGLASNNVERIVCDQTNVWALGDNKISVFNIEDGWMELAVKNSVVANGSQIYPNPATGDFISIKTNNWQDALYEIYNVNGSVIKTGKLTNANINIQQLASGSYFVKIFSNEKITFNKLIVTK
jgi:ligand-binding sensor domain-containing protein